MKINWHQNPFKTTVELDEHDKRTILLAYQNDEYVQMLVELEFGFTGKYNSEKFKTMEEAYEISKRWGEICNLDVDSEEIRMYIEYLDTPHCGDCTCVPMSCIRCRVEEMLDIDTTEKCGKHSFRNVEGAFGKDGDHTIDEAIAILEKPREYIKPSTWPDSVGYEEHIPRWKKEQEQAVSWLKRYKERHGF